uniref:Uncharacterized protein n=1 Tax=Setaria italica TaxID=4555 RepID=K3Z8A9_SETIT
MGNVNIVRKFIEICLDYDELLDNKRRNILHCAVEHGRVMLVRHICGNPKFLRMMNARDGEGNTPLHLSVKHGQAMIFFFLMVDPRVNLAIMNNEGSTPLDVASNKIQSDDTLLSSLTDTSIIICLNLCGAYGSPCHLAKKLKDNRCSKEKKESSIYANVSRNMFNNSIFIGFSSALAAASTPPGGYIAEGADAVLSMLITSVMSVWLTFDPENRWGEYIFDRLVSADLAVAIVLQVATLLWTSKHRWQDISKVIVQAILLIHVVRASIGTVQPLVKSVLAGQQEPCSSTGCVIQDDAVFLYPT